MVPRCPQDRCKPFCVRIMIGEKFPCLPLEIVFDSPNEHCRILHNSVAGPLVSIVRKSDASGVGNRESLQSTHKGAVDVSVDNGSTSQSDPKRSASHLQSHVPMVLGRG